jgi:hypothetical protein
MLLNPVIFKLTHIFSFSAVDFFNQVNLLYGTLAEFCTPESCPTMTAGPKYVIPSILFFGLVKQKQDKRKSYAKEVC